MAQPGTGVTRARRSTTAAGRWVLLCVLCVLVSGCVTYVGHAALFQVYGCVTDESGGPLSGVTVSVTSLRRCRCDEETQGNRALLTETDESGTIEADLIYEWGRKELGFVSRGAQPKKDRFAIELACQGYAPVRNEYRWLAIYDAETDSCVVDLGTVTLRKELEP